MRRTGTTVIVALLLALLLAAGCGDGDDDEDELPAVEYKVLGGRLVWCSGGAEDLTVPESATSIGNNAFNNCGTIRTLTIPKSVTYIMSGTFSRVTIGTIYFGGTRDEWVALVDGFGVTLDGTLVICVGDDTTWKWTAPAVPDVPIKPDEPGEIKDGVFVRYTGNAADVTIPDGVTAIGDGAFAGCAGITHVTIPESVKSIGESAFKDCASLTDIEIPDGVAVIGENAFAGCDSLTNIDIPASVETVGAGAIPAGTAVTYHGTAERWDELAKDGGLDGVTVFITDETDTPTHTHTWGEAYTNGGADGHYQTCTAEGCSEHSPVDAHTYGAYTDDGNGSHRQTCSVCGHTKSDPHAYGNEAFTDAGHTKTCTECKHSETTPHVWGEAYTDGGEDGHYQTCTAEGCSEHSATVPHDCTYTEDGDTHTMTCTVCGYSNTEEHGYSYTRTDAVYHSGVCARCDARVEGERHVYSGDVCGNCGSPKPVLEGGTIDDNGKLTKYDGAATTLEIPEGVTGIGASVFKDCTSLTSVTIPDSVTDIGNYVFKGCTSLTTVTIPSSMTSIGSSAFYGCTSLTGVIILDGVKTIAIEVFSGCTNLTSVTIPASVTIIGKSAFSRCDKLKTVNYGGTEEQWEAIRKISGYGLVGKTIVGSDGSTWTAE